MTIPQKWAERFGNEFYQHQHSSSLDTQDEDEWKLRMEGQLFDTGQRLQVTEFDELKRFIHQELSQGIRQEGVTTNA